MHVGSYLKIVRNKRMKDTQKQISDSCETGYTDV